MRVQSLGQEDPMEKVRQSTPVFLPGESHGQRSLAGYGPQARKKLNVTEMTQHGTAHSFEFMLVQGSARSARKARRCVFSFFFCESSLLHHIISILLVKNKEEKGYFWEVSSICCINCLSLIIFPISVNGFTNCSSLVIFHLLCLSTCTAAI